MNRHVELVYLYLLVKYAFHMSFILLVRVCLELSKVGKKNLKVAYLWTREYLAKKK